MKCRVFLVIFFGFSLGFALSAEEKTAQTFRYRVTSEDIGLQIISIRLYGTLKKWHELAKWNHLETPYPIRIGQYLILEEKPTFTEKEGEAEVMKVWRQRFQLSVDAVEMKAIEIQHIKKKEEKRKEIKKEFLVTFQEIQKKEEPEKAKEEVTAEKKFANGETYFNNKQHEEALVEFRKSHELDPEPLPAWFYEIRILRLLNREEEAKKTAKVLFKVHPEVEQLPMFQLMFEGEGDKK